MNPLLFSLRGLLAIFLLFPVCLPAQPDEWEDLLSVFSEDSARKMLAARYGQAAIPAPDPVAVKALIDQHPNQWVRWPVYGFEVKKIEQASLINAEIRRFSPDGSYLFMPKNKTLRIYDGKTGQYLKKIDLPPETSSEVVRWHHKLNILYVTHKNQIIGHDIKNNRSFQVNYTGPEIGWVSKAGWRAPAGGDANDISAKGYYLLTHGKYKSACVVRFDESDPAILHIVTKKPWDLPEGTDYATVNVNSTGIVVIGQKNSGIPILLYDFEGNKIETLYGSRGHTEQFWYWDAGKKKPAFIVKYNPDRARFHKGNTGDKVIIHYDYQDGKAQIEHQPLIKWNIPGQRLHPQNANAQYSYAGYDSKSLILALNPPKFPDMYHAYIGEILEGSLDSSDPTVRRVMHNLCSRSSPVHLQAEAGANHDGSLIWVKTDMGGLLKMRDQYILLVRIPPRTTPSKRKRLLSQ
ncbi:MAG: hypothetical protein AAF587_35505 [Bacteroidota bacterium]